MTERSMIKPDETTAAVVTPLPSGETPIVVIDDPEATALMKPRRRRRDYGAVFGVVWIGGVILLAALADVLPFPSPDATSQDYALAPFQSASHVLGTDQLGRDLLSRGIFGARVSMSVAIGATLLSLVVGTTLGMAAGYLRGMTDSVFTIFTNVLLAFPPLIFLIALVAALRPSIATLIVGLAIVGLSTFARIARANTIAFAHREFVTAAKAMGAGNASILVRELLANVFLPVMSFALVVMAALVVAEGSLSFLGLGVPPPAPSWGGMIAAGRERLEQSPHLVIVPGAFFFLTVFSLNRLGDWARGRVGKESSL